MECLYLTMTMTTLSTITTTPTTTITTTTTTTTTTTATSSSSSSNGLPEECSQYSDGPYIKPCWRLDFLSLQTASET
jgi:hypothetical protein